MAKGRSFVVNVFHGVSVHSKADCGCAAIENLSGVRYLSVDAPLLPLDSCNSPGSCRCTYKHYQDRRSGIRRDSDSDIGLPANRLAFQNQEDKRLILGRRITDAA
jgi:hypothetical protein